MTSETEPTEKILIMDSVGLERLSVGAVIVRRNAVVLQSRQRDLGIAINRTYGYYGPNHYSIVILPGYYDTNDPHLFENPALLEELKTVNLFEVNQNEARKRRELPLIEVRHFFALDKHEDPLLVVVKPGPEKVIKEPGLSMTMPIGIFVGSQDYLWDLSIDDLRLENPDVEERLSAYHEQLARLKPEIDLSELNDFRRKRREYEEKRKKAGRSRGLSLGFDLLN